MSVGLWGRLSLRWQAAVAILLPAIAIAVFSSLYFPARLNLQAEKSLEAKALALGALAVEEVAPTLGLIESGIPPEEFDPVLKGIMQGGDVSYAAVVELRAQPKVLRAQGIRPLELSTLNVTVAGCHIDEGESFVLRCRMDHGAESVRGP
ncbi:MAG: hypothetical protein ACT4TC_01565 [Myxococcaceae bacterium]